MFADRSSVAIEPIFPAPRTRAFISGLSLVLLIKDFCRHYYLWIEQVIRMGKEGPTFFEFYDPALKLFNEIEAEALPFAGTLMAFSARYKPPIANPWTDVCERENGCHKNLRDYFASVVFNELEVFVAYFSIFN